MIRLAKKILLIGWDAADWKLINPLVDAGLMPTLSRLIDSGCVGNIATLQPVLSPMLWTSIATGKTADAHGICGFVEPLPDASGVALVGSTSRRTKAIWNILTQRQFRTHAVNWYASHPAEPISGVCVSDQFCDLTKIDEANKRWPMLADAVHPAELSQSVAGLRVRPNEIGANDLLPLISRLHEIDLRADDRPAKLARVLASCASTHCVATAILQQEPWDFLAVYYDALDRAGHEFMPFHPPRMPSVSERDFELYSGVMNGLYRFHDMLLARLLELAGDEVTVIIVSDHGFHSDHLRPLTSSSTEEAQAAAWHRHFGMIAMSGPGIVKDERVYGATLLDVAPTILTLFGLPIGADMPGKPLVQAIDSKIEIDRIPSWDTEPGESGMHPPDKRSDAFASSAAMQQLVDLGYLAPAGNDVTAQIAQATRESQFNLAIVHSTNQRPAKAEPILRQLVRDNPNERRYVFSLANCLMEINRHADALEVLKPLDSNPDGDIDLLIGQCLMATGDTAAALERLTRAERGAPNQPALHAALANAYHALARYEDAIRAGERVVQIDPDNAPAHFGLARSFIAVKRFDDAVAHALAAVGLVHHFPQAHYALGLALEQLGQSDRAIRSMQMAVELAPNFPEAHGRLATLLLQRGDVQAALHHRRMAEGATRAKTQP